MGPRFRVRSRRIGEGLERRQVVETLETGSIVIIDEAVEESITVGVRDEEPMSDAAFGLATDGFDDAAVKSFDETIGLRPVWSCQAVVDSAFGADLIERMTAGRSIMRLVLHIDGEAIGELAAVVGEDGVNAMREVDEEAFEEAAGGIGIALGMDFQIDIAGGAVDGDEGVALAPLQGRQMLDIDMNEADGGLLEDADFGLVGLGSPVEGMAFETPMDGAAGELGIDAAAHHLGDVIERQLQVR